MSISVVVPVYNESGKVDEVVKRVLAVQVVTEVVIVDDGSTDGGMEQSVWGDDERVVVVHHERNRGKGAAIRTALKKCRGDIVVIQDADLEYEPEDIARLVAPLLSRDAEVAYGTRFGSGDRQDTRYDRYAANRLLTWLSNLFTGLTISDMETGHKAFYREMLDGITLREDRFGFEPELTIKLARRGCRFVEVPVSYAPRSYAEGKKIGPRDGLRALWCIMRYSWWS